MRATSPMARVCQFTGRLLLWASSLIGKIFRGSSVGRAVGCEQGLAWYNYNMPEKRTYADRAAYMVKAVSRRRKKLREMARESLGNKCVICGYNKCQRALVFHHLDPEKKDFSLSARGLTRSWIKIQAEIDKCILLCANCHMEVHDGITQPPKAT